MPALWARPAARCLGRIRGSELSRGEAIGFQAGGVRSNLCRQNVFSVALIVLPAPLVLIDLSRGQAADRLSTARYRFLFYMHVDLGRVVYAGGGVPMYHWSGGTTHGAEADRQNTGCGDSSERSEYSNHESAAGPGEGGAERKLCVR